MKHLAIALALGDIYDSAGAGVLKVPLDGTVLRFLISIAELQPNTTLVVASAGYSKEDPTQYNDQRWVSLATQLEYYVGSHNPQWLPRLVATPRCWSTRNEIRIGIKTALRTFATREEEVTVVVATNLAHLPRTWLYLMVYSPQKWHLKLRRAHNDFSLQAHLGEPIKFVRDLWYFGRVHYRLWRRRHTN